MEGDEKYIWQNWTKATKKYSETTKQKTTKIKHPQPPRKTTKNHTKKNEKQTKHSFILQIHIKWHLSDTF